MDNFLINVQLDNSSGNYVAVMADGNDIFLSATTYEDAVIEADNVVYS